MARNMKRTAVKFVGAIGLGGVVVAAVYLPAAMGSVLALFSVVVFVWAVLGLIRPDWARLPNRLASVGVWALSVVLFIAAAWLIPPEPADSPEDAPVGNPAVVAADTWADGTWPLTVDGGVLTCVSRPQGEAVFIALDDGTMWPLNGVARTIHAQFGAEPATEPIWRENPELPGTRINIGPLISRALGLCPSR